MKTVSSLLLVLLLGATLPLAALAQLTIATPAAYGWLPLYGSSSSWGSEAWGQTFVAPDATHTQLDRFELRAGSDLSYTAANFTTFLAQWDTTAQSVVGAPLWTSSLQSAAGLTNYSLGGNTLSFDTGGISLTAGQSYLLLALAAPPSPSDPHQTTVLGYTYPSTYAGGDLVQFYSPSNTLTYATLSTRATWSDFDLAFGATFSEPGSNAVPEPAAPAAVFGLTLAAGLFAFRRHQRSRAPLLAAPSTSP